MMQTNQWQLGRGRKWAQKRWMDSNEDDLRLTRRTTRVIKQGKNTIKQGKNTITSRSMTASIHFYTTSQPYSKFIFTS